MDIGGASAPPTVNDTLVLKIQVVALSMGYCCPNVPKKEKKKEIILFDYLYFLEV